MEHTKEVNEREAERMPGLTVGRMVHYVNRYGDHYAAVVVRVWDHVAGEVTLQVFGNGPYSIKEHIPFDGGGEKDQQSARTVRPRTWHWIEPA